MIWLVKYPKVMYLINLKILCSVKTFKNYNRIKAVLSKFEINCDSNHISIWYLRWINVQKNVNFSKFYSHPCFFIINTEYPIVGFFFAFHLTRCFVVSGWTTDRWKSTGHESKIMKLVTIHFPGIMIDGIYMFPAVNQDPGSNFYPKLFCNKDRKRGKYTVTRCKIAADTGVLWKNNGGYQRFLDSSDTLQPISSKFKSLPVSLQKFAFKKSPQPWQIISGLINSRCFSVKFH